jgi:hypothetical protein
MHESNIDYREVQIHYSKPIIENGKDLGLEYTDSENEAHWVCVYTQTYFKDGAEFDINEEKEFDIHELGHSKAVEEAEKYADELSTKHKTYWGWY